jgi:ribosomal protein L11 methylase PrmA
MSDNSKSSEDEIPLAFVPPLWMQRIDKVKEILAGLKAAEICDLGCGSGKLISELIYFKGINKLIGVDVDSECLVRAVEECNPGVAAYINKRKKKFEIDILQGSILEPCDQVPFQIEAVTLCEV